MVVVISFFSGSLDRERYAVEANFIKCQSMMLDQCGSRRVALTMSHMVELRRIEASQGVFCAKLLQTAWTVSNVGELLAKSSCGYDVIPD